MILQLLCWSECCGLGIYTSFVPYAKFVISVLVSFVCVCVCVCTHIPKPVQRHGQVKVQSCAQLQLSGWGFNLKCGVRTFLFTTSRKVLGSNFPTIQWGLVLLGRWSHWHGWEFMKVHLYFYTPSWRKAEWHKNLSLSIMLWRLCAEWKPAGTLSICIGRYMPCQKLDQNITICRIYGRHQENTLRY